MPHIESTAESLARIARTNESERYRALSMLEAIWHGRRYEMECRPSFWSREVPLAERAPCVVDPIARKAGRRLAAMVFGERAFPAFECPDAALARCIASIKTVARLPRQMRLAVEQGLMCGTVVVVCKLCEGRPAIELIPAKWCTPSHAGGRLTEVDVRYRYSAPDRAGRPALWWHRRTITATADTTYLPVEVNEDGREPVWIADPAQTYALDMLPVLWHRNSPDPGSYDVDGCALIEGLEDECEALDFALSQHHRNGRYNGEPQTYVTGVEEGKGLQAEKGRAAALPPGESAFESRQTVVKKAPTSVWRLPPGAAAGQLESSGAGAQVLQADAAGLTRLILDTVGVIIASPDSLGSSDLSARALGILMQPMTDHADDMRVEYGDLLRAILTLFLRLIAAANARGEAVLVDGVPEAATAMAPYVARDPPVTLAWPPYFAPSWSEVQSAFTAATGAAGGRAVISRKRAVQMLAPMTNVVNVEAELAEIERDDLAGATGTASMLGALGGGPPPPTAAPSAPTISPPSTGTTSTQGTSP